MKLYAVAITGFLTLNIIAVAFTASVRSYAASDSEPSDWKEHASKADKRSMECTGCTSMDHNAEVTAKKRTMECAECANMDDNAAMQPVQKPSPNPMNPYLSLKPFLPVKPAFVPPFLDPNYFINSKAALLNNLFGATNTESFYPKPSLAEAKRDAADESASSVQPRLAPLSPFLAVSPTVKPTIVPPGYWMPMNGPGIVDPAAMIDKKTTFLNTLFSKIAAPGSSVAARTVVPEDVTSAASTAKQSAVPTDLWLQFLPSFSTPEPPTVKPTIVPPGFWIPSSVSKTPAMPFSPKIPSVDPSEFIDKKTAFLNTLFKTLNISIAPTTETTAESTPDPVPAYLQKVVSPTVKPTIVPPGYWMPMSGPGIVDPAAMIDKKTTFLNTLFSKIAAAGSSVAARAVVPEDLTSATSTAKQSAVPTDFWLQFLPSFITPEPPTVKPTIVPPGFWIPSYVSKASAKPFSPKIPSVDPSEFIDKKTTFLNTLSKTLNITIAPSTAPKTIPEPIADLLYQLLSSAVSNSTLKRSMTERGAEDISVQSSMPVDALLDAKDRLINTIMSALSGIKNNILDTISELLAQQKEAAAISASTASKKKPGPPFGPWGAALLKTTPKPTLDPAPFQNKVEFLSQMFDAVTKLEKDVTDTLNEAINESFSQLTASPTVASVTSMDEVTNATALLQLIKSKLSELADDSSDMQVPKFSRATLPKGFSTGLPTPMPTIVDPSFWIPKVAPGTGVDPTFYLSKTQDFLSKLFASKTAGTSADNSETTAYSKARSIKMAVHQGYQSLPPGTEELLQAGGGSNSMDHEGGGLKLQDDVFPVPVMPNNREGHHHHHNK